MCDQHVKRVAAFALAKHVGNHEWDELLVLFQTAHFAPVLA